MPGTGGSDKERDFWQFDATETQNMRQGVVKVRLEGKVTDDLRRHMKECVSFPHVFLFFPPQPGHCNGWSFSWSVRPRLILQNEGKFQIQQLNNLFIRFFSEYLCSIYYVVGTVDRYRFKYIALTLKELRIVRETDNKQE